ncbi:protein Wnt-10a [Contarinia nasturtii]|uniref:protein Wnt-10a n=1 Tax=Contarinia nasturtii TaxID=265458 RepID=UPI0012D3D2C0|nr:protein Wnt-10a [Contarinia nasturtii]
MARWTEPVIATFLLVLFQRIMYSSSDIRSNCRIMGLTREQLDLCYKANDVTIAALDGLDLARRECQLQFQWHRWNCSSLNIKKRNPFTSNLFKKGYKESAFAYAISAAGTVQSIARSCSQGRLISCGCDPSVNRKGLTKSLRKYLELDKQHFFQTIDNRIINAAPTPRLKASNQWKWGGCSADMNFGIEFSELFLDSLEKAGDIQSKINLHNNHVGRMAVANNMQIRCKCHGLSGSCQLKTCWKSAPEFRIVGKVLKHMFRNAILVNQSNMGNGEALIPSNRFGGKHRSRNAIRSPRKIFNKHSSMRSSEKANENTLFYYQRSPTFCDRDPLADIHGTSGRRCNLNSTGVGSCSSMCCGRGYNLVKEHRVEKCACKFQWCCHVKCETCIYDEWISTCK